MALDFYITLNDTFVMDACVARNRDSYVTLALTLGSDTDLRRRVASAIRDKSHTLWNDMQTVYEWAAFLSSVSGRRPPPPDSFGWKAIGLCRNPSEPIYYHGELPTLKFGATVIR